jgi:hypothetical protein
MKILAISRAFAICLLLLAGSAWAQIDPDLDGIGIYFDTEASLICTDAQAGQFVQAYLIGTRLSQPGDIGYWSARLCPNGPAAIFGSPYGSYNYSMNMPGDSCWSCAAMGMDPALPTGDITLLASLTIEVWYTEEPISLYVLDGSFYQVYDAGYLEFPFHPASGSADLAVARINGPAPVANRSGTLDALKALYR